MSLTTTGADAAVIAHLCFNPSTERKVPAGTESSLVESLSSACETLSSSLNDPATALQQLHIITKICSHAQGVVCKFFTGQAFKNLELLVASFMAFCEACSGGGPDDEYLRAVVVKYLKLFRTLRKTGVRIHQSGDVSAAISTLLRTMYEDLDLVNHSKSTLQFFAVEPSSLYGFNVVPTAGISRLQNPGTEVFSSICLVNKQLWQLSFCSMPKDASQSTDHLLVKVFAYSHHDLDVEFELVVQHQKFSLSKIAEVKAKHLFCMQSPSYNVEVQCNLEEFISMCAHQSNRLNSHLKIVKVEEKSPKKSSTKEDLFSHVPEKYRKYLDRVTIETETLDDVYGLPDEAFAAQQEAIFADEEAYLENTATSTLQPSTPLSAETPSFDLPQKGSGPSSKEIMKQEVPEGKRPIEVKPAVVTSHWGKTKLYRHGPNDEPQKGEPYFPYSYDIGKHEIFMCTDLKMNYNKFYSLEYHTARDKFGKQHHRLYTHYGRTDDLVRNKKAGRRECRYFKSEAEAMAVYDLIVKDKTSDYKGYKKIELASLNVGSYRARIAQNKPATKSVSSADASMSTSSLNPNVQELVNYVFDEAFSVLTNVIAGRITARGIETPLGILTHEQIDKGRNILLQVYKVLENCSGNIDENTDEQLLKLSGDFYSHIPHRFGRSKHDIEKAKLADLRTIEDKLDLLQLMADMLRVNNDGKVLFNNILDMKYKALKCEINHIDNSSFEFMRLERDFQLTKRSDSGKMKVHNIFKVKRESESTNFKDGVHDHRLLYHGSRIQNFVGLLSRGLLMPQLVIKGSLAKRTDAGFLGNGIYFASEASTSAQYTSCGKKGTRLMLIAEVALGRIKEYTERVYGIDSAPEGYDSVRGVRSSSARPSAFQDDEYVIYEKNQQKLEYLVEFSLDGDIVHQQFGSTAESFGNDTKMWMNSHPSNIGNSSDAKIAPPDPLEQILNTFQEDQKAIDTLSSSKVDNNDNKDDEEEEDYNDEEEDALSEKLNENALKVSGHVDDDSSTLKIKKSVYDLSLGLKEFGIEEMQEIENKYRGLYANDRTNPLLDNPYLFLIDAFQNRSMFKYQEESSEEADIPKILTKERRLGREGYSITDRKKFLENWNTYTNGQLEGLDWNNIFVAGGAILQNVVTDNEKGYKGTDIDLFFYNMTEEEANKKLIHVYEVVKQNTKNAGEEVNIIRSANAVTLLGSYPYRHIQIVLRLYKSPAEVLMGFDIDSCCIGFDGRDVWILPRCRRAINKGFNLVDLSRRSLTYEIRLFKYSKRGFAVAVPNLKRSLIDPMLFNRNVNELQGGLAKLLLFEFNVNNGRPPHSYSDIARRRLKKFMSFNNEENEDKFAEYDANVNLDPSDYSNFTIPWGPQWSGWLIMRLLKFHDKANMFTKHHKHTFVYGIDAVVNGIPDQQEVAIENLTTPNDTQQENSDENNDENKPQALNFGKKKNKKSKHRNIANNMAKFVNSNDEVRKPLSWLIENPGRQLLTGSFHPVDDDKWDQYVYLTNDQERVQRLCNAAFQSDINTMMELERMQVNINGRDGFHSRAAIHYAAIYGNSDCAKYLVSVGSNVNLPDDSDNSFRPLHYAIMNANEAVVEQLIELGANVNLPDRKYKLTPLHLASYYNRPKSIRFLLQNGAKADVTDCQGRYPIHLAALTNNSDCVQELIKTNLELASKPTSANTESALMAAVKISLQCVAALSQQQSTDVHVYAADEQSMTQVNPLIKHEVETENRRHYQDKTFPLLSAVMQGDEKLVHKNLHLIEQEPAKVTSLHVAAKYNDLAIMKILIEKGGMQSSINAKDILGQTPLHYACRYGADRVALYLLEQGADIEARNTYGHTPLYYVLDMLGTFTGFTNNTLFDLKPFEVMTRQVNIRNLLIQREATYPSVCPFVPASNYSIPPLPYSSYLLEYPFTSPQHYGEQVSSLSRKLPSPPSKSALTEQAHKSLADITNASSMLQQDQEGPSATTKALMMCALLFKGGSITESEKLLLKKLIISGNSREILEALKVYESNYNIGKLIKKFRNVASKYSNKNEDEWFNVEQDLIETSSTTSSGSSALSSQSSSTAESKN